MRSRCKSTYATGYEYYGGRGITVCKRWDDFYTFAEDIGEKPSINHSLDRIDNDGNYEPSNCKWSTREEQASNRSKHPNINLAHNKITGLNKMTLYITDQVRNDLCNIQNQSVKEGKKKSFGNIIGDLLSRYPSDE